MVEQQCEEPRCIRECFSAARIANVRFRRASGACQPIAAECRTSSAEMVMRYTNLAIAIGATAAALHAATASRRLDAARDRAAPPPLVLPGAAELRGTRFSTRCDSVWYVATDSGARSNERIMLPHRSSETVTTRAGAPVVALVTSIGSGKTRILDSGLVYRDGLAPIVEVSRSGGRTTTYTYKEKHVVLSLEGTPRADSTISHTYAQPVFSFQELEPVLRSLPLRDGYTAVLPLYSEGDDASEVDTVRVVGRAPNGWRLHFADAAIVATLVIDSATRTVSAYSHVFRKAGPSWKAGTTWRRVTATCANR
jgi:hypothetical protein